MTLLKVKETLVDCGHLDERVVEELNKALNGTDVEFINQESKYTYNGKDLRTLFNEIIVFDEETDGEYCLYEIVNPDKLVLFNKIEELLNKLVNEPKVSLDLLNYMNMVYNINTDKDLECEPMGIVNCHIVNNLDSFTNGKFNSLLRVYYDILSDEGNKVFDDSKFSRVLVNTPDGWIEEQCSTFDGIKLYISNCLNVDKYIPYEPLNNYFNNFDRLNGNFNTADTPFKAIEMFLMRSTKELEEDTINLEDSRAIDILRNMYKVNIMGYLQADMNCYLLLKLEDNKLSMVNWAYELFDFEDLEHTDDKRNSIISYLLDMEWEDVLELEKHIDKLKDVIKTNNYIELPVREN